jgi:catechol 2,3-dioxygenase-like lactoylglutathione lyase family enzyme
MIHLHHVHLFSHDLSAAIDWYKRALSAEVYYDGDFGGSRNVFMKVGSGRIHLYSQAPRYKGSGPCIISGFAQMIWPACIRD